MTCTRIGSVTLISILALVGSHAAAGDAITAFGLSHQPIGDAELTYADEILTIDITNPRGDGVLITPGDIAGWSAAVDFGPAGALAPDTRLDLIAAFDVADAPVNAHLAFVEADDGLTSIELLDLTTSGAAAVELRLDGVVVDTIALGRPPFGEIARGAVGSNNGEAPLVRTDWTTTDGERTRAIVVVAPEPTLLALAGSAPVLANELRVRTAAPVSGPIADASVTVTASGLDAFTLERAGVTQFDVDWRAAGALAFAGELDGANAPTMRIADVETFDGATIDLAPAEAVDAVATADLCAVIEGPAGAPPFLAWRRIVHGRAESGATIEIAAATFYMGSCGCAYAFLADDPPLDGNPVKTVIARLNGADVALIADKPGFNMWSTGSVQLPDRWTFELDPAAPDGHFAYRERCRWDAPTSIYIQETGYIEADEVEVRVVAAAPPGETPVAIERMTVQHTEFFDAAVEVVYTDAAFGSSCPGDIDGDGAVGAADLAVLLSAWGDCAGCPSDLDGDGVVDAGDLAMLLSGWGGCPG